MIDTCIKKRENKNTSTQVQECVIVCCKATTSVMVE